MDVSVIKSGPREAFDKIWIFLHEEGISFSSMQKSAIFFARNTFFYQGIFFVPWCVTSSLVYVLSERKFINNENLFYLVFNGFGVSIV